MERGDLRLKLSKVVTHSSYQRIIWELKVYLRLYLTDSLLV